MLKNSSKLHLILKIYRFKRYSRTVNSFATQVACNRGIWKLLRRTHATHLKPPLPETCVACKFPSCDTNSRNLSMQKKLPPFCCCHIKMGYIFFFMYPLLMKLDPLLSKYKTNSYHKVLEPLHMIVVIRRGGKSIWHRAAPSWWNLTLCYQNTILTPIRWFLYPS